MPLDYGIATKVLDQAFSEAETAFQDKNPPTLDAGVEKHLNNLFSSNTQAYREVLIGSALVRYQDKRIDLRLPYVKHGRRAYNGRDLDEQVVNPFLKAKQIPSSKGPFLSVFRRGIKFTWTTKMGVRDRPAYGSFLNTIEHLEATTGQEDLRTFLKAVLYKFLALREASKIEIARVQRLSIPQYGGLIDGLLGISSGGRYAVFVVVAALQALKAALSLDWEIQYQGINVADAASEEPGDITVRRNGQTFLAAEVTERVVDKARVVSTFTTKIVPAGVGDYIFFVKFRTTGADPEAVTQARQYFAQGHEVNFLDIKTWALNTLATIGKNGRAVFISEMVKLLDADDVPRKMKVGWNEQVQKLTSI
jgi:hypothetical protein